MDNPAETARLRLRPFEIGDAPAISRLCGDYAVASMVSHAPHPYPVLAAEMWVLTLRAGRGRKPHFPFALEAKDGSGIVGACGVFRPGEAAPWEIGYWIGRPFWGQGYASEAARAVIAWSRARLGAGALTAGHFEDNPASARVLEKLGFAYTGAEGPRYCMARSAKVRTLEMELAADRAPPASA